MFLGIWPSEARGRFQAEATEGSPAPLPHPGVGKTVRLGLDPRSQSCDCQDPQWGL